MEEKMAERAMAHERLMTTVTRLEKRNKTLVKRQAQVGRDKARLEVESDADNVDQEEAFELERQEKIEAEKKLNSRIQQLQQELQAVRSKLERQAPPTPNSPLSERRASIEEPSFVAQVAIVSQLRAELADMTESQLSLSEMHTALQMQVHNLEHEVAERTAECYRLREENEGFEILLRERTLDGRVYDADVFGHMSDDEMSENEGSDAASLAIEDKSGNNDDTMVPIDRTDSSRARKKPQVLNLADDLGHTASTWDPQNVVSPILEVRTAPSDDKAKVEEHPQALGPGEDIAILSRFPI
jgi:hypothetical protein